MIRTVQEPARATEVWGEYDVVVLGGGPAGIAAAAASARDGASTLLVERYGFLGGMGTAAGVTNFCGLHANVRGEYRRVVEGLSRELTDRIDRLGGLNWPPHTVFGRIMAQAYDTAAFKCAADDLMRSTRVEMLYHALAVGCVTAVRPAGERRISGLLVETKSGRRAVLGRIFIDCSGDGDLAFWAKAPVEKGDEKGNLLYPTSMFRVGGVDPDRAASGEAIGRLMEDRGSRHRLHRCARPERGGNHRARTDPRVLLLPEEPCAGFRAVLSARYSAADRRAGDETGARRLRAYRGRRARLREL